MRDAVNTSRIAVEFIEVTKKYPGVVANNRVSFKVYEGEIHGLLGENGAGKTTLMKILYGLEHPDEGYIKIYGRIAGHRSPRDALREGIVMVQQYPSLIDRLTVEENILLELLGAGIKLGRERLREALRRIGEEYGLKLRPRAYGWQLSMGEKQRVELAKAILLNARILILDEPTTILSPVEVESLFRFVRRVSEKGVTVLFITHRLREALEVCDRITILRRGVVVGTVESSEATPARLVEMMFGSTPPQELKAPSTGRPGGVVLKAHRIWVRGDQGAWAVRDVSLTLRSGEIMGIVGVSGNGQRELAEALAGLRRVERGFIEVDGARFSRGYNPRIALNLGVSYIPEDRIGVGIARGLSVAENTVLRDLWWNKFVRRGIISWGRVREHASRIISSYGVKAPGLDVPVESLSGGNIQRLIVAREIERNPRILVAHNPTSGLDVSAANKIRRMLVEMSLKGTGIILFSDDLDEVLSLSSRVAVMYAGRLLGPLERGEINSRRLGYAMASGVL